jgi:hypothetical protein
MKQYNKYLVRSTDQFDPVNFSSVTDEIQIINEETANLPPLFKVEILMSFLKDHSVENYFSRANPELTDLVTSGSLLKGNIESLFESCRSNPAFRQGLETYLKKEFEKSHPQEERLEKGNTVNCIRIDN